MKTQHSHWYEQGERIAADSFRDAMEQQRRMREVAELWSQMKPSPPPVTFADVVERFDRLERLLLLFIEVMGKKEAIEVLERLRSEPHDKAM